MLQPLFSTPVKPVENLFGAKDLIAPVFVTEGGRVERRLSEFSAHVCVSLDLLEKHLCSMMSFGVRSVLLFGAPLQHDPTGSRALDENLLVPKAIRLIKDLGLELHVISDINICQYTDHGHCGVFDGNQIDNDASVELFVKQAQLHVSAGIDEIMPSSMSDGLVCHLRAMLQSEKKHNVKILSQAAKFASSLYGAARRDLFDTEVEAQQPLDKSSYQIDPANRTAALNKVRVDLQEGADAVMVKPLLGYLDVLTAIRREFAVPVSAFCTNGEHRMLLTASTLGYLNLGDALRELMNSAKRAGADRIVSYAAVEILENLSRSS